MSGRLVLSVYNNGAPMKQEKADLLNSLKNVPVSEMRQHFPDGRHGYGIINIITRLRLKYGEDVEYEYEIQEDGTKCVIRLPENGEKNDEL